MTGVKMTEAEMSKVLADVHKLIDKASTKGIDEDVALGCSKGVFSIGLICSIYLKED